jgi:hypothetical protein
MDGAVPVSVRPRESRKPSLSTASSGIVLDIPWIEAQGRVSAPPGADGRGQTVPGYLQPLTPSAACIGTSP